MKKDPYAPLRSTMNETPEYWRSLEHQQLDESVTSTVDSEFPNGITAPNGFNRRDAMKIAGASLALGSLAGCEKLRRDPDEILPFVKQPENYVPGNSLNYATTMQRSEGAIGLLAEANAGRPTKLEGNPAHPGSLGASDTWAQAEILKLYDPQRSKSPLKAGAAAKWDEFDAFSKEHFAKYVAAQGAGLAFLVEEDMGPTFERLLAKLPAAKVVRFDPLSPDHQLQGAQIAFGPGARVHADVSKAKVVFSVDSDFLVSGPDHLAHAAAFGKSRAVDSLEDINKMLRLYVAESAFSTTGTNADHRLRMSAGEGIILLKLLAQLLGLTKYVGEIEGTEAQRKFVTVLSKDLTAAKGASLVLVGERQDAGVHALANVINHALGNVGTTLNVSFPEAPVARVSMYDQMTGLVGALGGEVTTLVSFESNPLYTVPAAMGFAAAAAKATWVHCGVLPEESGMKATWHVPTAHFLESWGDARSWNRTASLVQPVILPLHGGRAPLSVLASMVGEAETNDRKLVEATWLGKGVADVKAWRRALHDGVIGGTARPGGAAELKPEADLVKAVMDSQWSIATKDALDFVAVEGHFKDGRLSNVSWLMELPDSMSKLCWDNALVVSPTFARELGINSAVQKNRYVSDVVEITAGGRTLKAPTFVLPGLPTYSVVMTRGYGRTWGDVATGVGANTNELLARGSVVTGVKVAKTNTTQELASTQDHFSVPGNPFRELTFAQMTGEPVGAPERTMGLGTRQLFRSASSNEVKQNGAKFAREGDMPGNLVQLGTPTNRPSKPIQPTTEITYEGQQWGMVIDLSSCIGCNVCAIACIAENNIPVVGREQVLLGREMHWIRVDRYFTGDIDTPRAVHQPLNCMHCENAPCEPVCPVGATTHDDEGINSMAYNRCIGTRYCANNCPYKVRRYNYLDFTHTGDFYVEPEWKERMRTLKLQRNPDVTVRYRGVMEKCTYCVQRIDEAKIAAKRRGEDRKKLPDGAVTPACAQACPTKAITFGNINDLESRVAKLKQSERNYELLQELNVRPRTTYLARVRNENEELA